METLFVPQIPQIAAGISSERKITFHKLRHTAASHLTMAGLTLPTIDEILGHKTAKMTLRYTHLTPEYLKNAVEKLDYSSPVKETSEKYIA